jgi:hypothetical protein
MRQVVQGTNVIVLVGAWNIAIFTPEWVKANLLSDVDFKVLFPSMVGCSLKFQTELLAFCIEGNRLQFEVTKQESLDDAYVEIIRLLRIILRKLAHTPVNAVGTNYVYDFDAPFEVLNTLQDNKPLQSIVKLIGTGVKSQALVRKFDMGEKKELTLRLESVDNGHNRIDFNFNYNVNNAGEITNLLGEDDQLLIQNQELARRIIDEVYGA